MLKTNGQDIEPLSAKIAPHPFGFPRRTEQPKPAPTPADEPVPASLTVIERVRRQHAESIQRLVEEAEHKGLVVVFGKTVTRARPAFAAERLTGPVQFLVRLLDVWGLERRDAIALLGYEPSDEALVEAILSGRGSLRGIDSKDRIAALTRIRSLLADMFRDLNTERAWLRAPKGELGNHSPLELLRRGSMEGLLTVRQYVEHLSGL